MFSHFLRKLCTLFARPNPTAVRAGGLVWHLLPAAGDLIPLLPTLFAHPTAAVVKQNLQRTILRIDLPGGAVYVKRSRANTPRAWAREILRPPKARLEFENAVRLRELDISCAEPLAWAEADSLWPGESAVVTREVTGGVPLDEYLTDRLTLAERRTVAVELGRLFARMHAAGVAHPDPHPGNLLVQTTADGPRFVLLDVHAVRFGRPLTWAEARDNLVLFNRWFQLRASRTDRARFWREYEKRPHPPSPSPLRRGSVQPETAQDVPPTAFEGQLEEHNRARALSTPSPLRRGGRGVRSLELESLTAASNRRFWAARDDRYLGSNRQFRKVKGRGVRGHAVRELPDELVKSWLADPDAVFTQPGVVVLKDSPSATVAIVNGVLFKRFRMKRRTDALKNLLRRSEALRSWVFGHGLLDRHLPTARPLFVAHRSRHGVPREGYVAFEVVPDAVELPAFVASADFPQQRALCEPLGRLIRTLHDRGVSQRDLKPANILISGPDRRPVFIDLVGLCVHAEVPATIRRRDLTRLNAGFVRSAHVSRTLRLRLLLAYLRAWPALADDWKTWWRGIAAATERKVLKNLHRGRPLA